MVEHLERFREAICFSGQPGKIMAQQTICSFNSVRVRLTPKMFIVIKLFIWLPIIRGVFFRIYMADILIKLFKSI